MSTRNCRRNETQREQHERAVRIRKMTDAQLCDYIDNLEAGNRPAAPNPPEIIADFLDKLTTRSDSGLRVSDATIRKLRQWAVEMGCIQ